MFGLEIIRELERHGYELSPGTLYPILHDLDERGYLSSSREVVSGKVRKYYVATEKGIKALEEAVVQAKELMNEIQE